MPHILWESAINFFWWSFKNKQILLITVGLVIFFLIMSVYCLISMLQAIYLHNYSNTSFNSKFLEIIIKSSTLINSIKSKYWNTLSSISFSQSILEYNSIISQMSNNLQIILSD